MKTKKLFLIIALVVSCAVGAHAQKTVFKFRDAQHVQAMQLLKFVSNPQLSR